MWQRARVWLESVSGAVEAGQAAPEGLSVTRRLLVVISGAEVEAESAGLVPGATGLYQAVVRVPPSSSTTEGKLNVAKFNPI